MSEKAEKTREKILDTAIKHFLRDGFSGASLRSIEYLNLDRDKSTFKSHRDFCF